MTATPVRFPITDNPGDPSNDHDLSRSRAKPAATRILMAVAALALHCCGATVLLAGCAWDPIASQVAPGTASDLSGGRVGACSGSM